MYQVQYWVELQNLRAHVLYLELYQIRSESMERCISIVLAVASSGSIAGWIIWKEYAFAWGLFIALSQVISVVYRYLPFKARIQPLSTAAVELSILADEAERGWFDVAQGTLTEREINDARFAIRKKKSTIMAAAFKGMVLPENAGVMKKAESQMHLYFSTHYPESSDERQESTAAP